MKTALLNNQLILANQAKRSEEFFCPRCHQKVELRSGETKSPYFAHLKSRVKATGQGESDIHQKMKLRLMMNAQNDGLNACQELYLPKIKQRIDVAIENEGQVIAVEVQCSPITKHELEQRTKGYRTLGIRSWWIAGPRHLVNRNFKRSAQKFMTYNTKAGFWFAGIVDAQKMNINIFYNLRLDIFGKVVYQSATVDPSLVALTVLFKKLCLNKQSNIPLSKEVSQICYIIMNGKIDPKYQQLAHECYELGVNLMGCPWIIHFPRNVSPIHEGVPLINRIKVLLAIKKGIGKQLTSNQYLQYLVSNKLVKYDHKRERYILHNYIKWYADSNAKLADDMLLTKLEKLLNI